MIIFKHLNASTSFIFFKVFLYLRCSDSYSILPHVHHILRGHYDIRCQKNQDFSYFAQDLKFSEDGTKLEASRILGFMKSSGSSTFQKNAMLTLREDIADKSNFDAFLITRPFIFFEQYTIGYSGFNSQWG